MLDPKIKKLLGYKLEEPDDKVMANWKERASRVCKPCWEIRYCPYGPLVEDFPLLPMTLEEALEDHEDLISTLESGKRRNGKPLEKRLRAIFREMVNEFDPDEYPSKIPKEIAETACTVFGHICPVVFVAEGFSETPEPRRRGRSIPNPVLLRVVRRDDSTCQICGKHLLADEIELDHIVPVSKGGSSEENNLRVTCIKCNRKKSDRVGRIKGGE